MGGSKRLALLGRSEVPPSSPCVDMCSAERIIVASSGSAPSEWVCGMNGRRLLLVVGAALLAFGQLTDGVDGGYIRRTDLSGNGTVNASDFGAILVYWQQPCT